MSFQQESSNTSQGPFANSTLYLFSRDGNSLFGSGSLDELAIYNQPLSATTIFEHDHSNNVDLAQVPAFTINPAPATTGQSVTFNASGSTDSQGSITDYRWDLDGSGNYATDSGSSPTLTHAFTQPGTYVIGLQTTDSTGAIARTTHTLTVTLAPPSTPVLTLSGATGNTLLAGSTAYTNPQSGSSGSSTVSAQTSDPGSGIKNVVFPALTGFSGGGGTLTATPYQSTYTWSGAGAGASGPQTVTANDNAGLSASANFTVVPDTTAPTAGALSVNGAAANSRRHRELQRHRELSRSRTHRLRRGGDRRASRCCAPSTLSPSPPRRSPATSAAASAHPARSPAARPKASRPAATATRSPAWTTWATRPASPRPCSWTRPAPTTPSLSFSGLSSNTYYKSSTNALYFNPSPGGAFTLTASSSDPNTGIAGYTFSSLSSFGFTGAPERGADPLLVRRLGHTAAGGPTVSAASNAGATSFSRQLRTDRRRHAGPSGGALSINGAAATGAGSTSYSTSGSFTIGTRTDYNADTGSGLFCLGAHPHHGDALQWCLQRLRHSGHAHRQPRPKRAGSRLLPAMC